MSADIAQTGNICRHHEMSADIARLQMCANIYMMCNESDQRDANKNAVYSKP